MASVLQQLDNDEAVLLIYLAGELPAADAAVVERRLASDARLRRELDRLRSAYGSMQSAVERDDRLARLPVPESVAVRRVGRAMRLWHARRLASPANAAPAVSVLRYPWWAYPLAAAASILLAFIVWWGNNDRPLIGPDGVRWVRVAPEPAEVQDPSGNTAEPDPGIIQYLSAELLAESLRVGEAVEPAADWDDSPLSLAVAPSDENVLMLLDEHEAAEDDDAAPEHGDFSIQ